MTASMGLFNAAEARRDQIAQVDENSSRAATFTMVHETTGVGYITAPTAFAFDVTFIEEPSIATGVSIVRAPDTRWWQYPMVTAGVYRWQRDRRTGYYTGAFLYFVVKCEENPLAGSNSPAIQGLQNQIVGLQNELDGNNSGHPQYRSNATLTHLITQAQASIDQLDAQDAAEIEPANPKLAHHLTFTGTAMKDLPDTVTSELTASTPRIAGFGVSSS